MLSYWYLMHHVSGLQIIVSAKEIQFEQLDIHRVTKAYIQVPVQIRLDFSESPHPPSHWFCICCEHTCSYNFTFIIMIAEYHYHSYCRN